MRVFDASFRRKLRRKYPGRSKRYSRPYAATLALDRRLSRERGKIERWFRDAEDSQKADLMARLRSEESQQHFGAYYELVTKEFFKKLGYSVEMSHAFGNDRPDLLLTGNKLVKPIVVEVATIFDDPERMHEERKLNLILDELDGMRGYFFLGVSVRGTPIPEVTDYKALKSFIDRWFEAHDTGSTDAMDETEYVDGGLDLRLTLIPKSPRYRKKKGPIIGSHGLPARFIDEKQIRSALSKKAAKYDFVKDEGYHYIVAAGLYDSFADNDSIVDALFGRQVLTIRYGHDGSVIDEQTHRDGKGLCKINRNTRLSGVLAISTRGETFYPDILGPLVKLNERSWLGSTIVRRFGKPVRVHYCSIVRNPYASTPLPDSFMDGYPQFRKTQEDTSGTTYSWVDKASIPFEH